MFSKVLIANRGAIACRIMRTLRGMGVRTVAVYSKADADSLHVEQADEAVCLGEALAAETYLDSGKILRAARDTGAQAIHPGYGFLAENAGFAQICAAQGVVFIGPTPPQLRAFGFKHTARELASASGLPLLPGTGLLSDLDAALAKAEAIGYPVMLKSTAGGGGIGMQLCHAPGELDAAYASVRRLSQNNFSDGGMYLEKYVTHARHIEVQIFGDGRGKVVSLGERDCSLQRRNQKVVEETPAPGLSEETRQALARHACRLGEAVAYQSAGTVEYVFDTAANTFYFLEVNTRLQVEHGVTEEVTGVDLVEWMVRLAAGEPLTLALPPPVAGHAIQVRLYAEDPKRAFQPAAGLLTRVVWPTAARCDTWVTAGVDVPPFYDPMLAKIIVKGDDRKTALQSLETVLAQTEIDGIETNLDYLRQVIRSEVFQQGRQYTAFLGRFDYAAATIEVLAPGTDTTVQAFPGRLGYWHIGVPPSGPMDALAFRLANRVLENPEDAAGLELTISGPALRFNTSAVICLAGAAMPALLDGKPIPYWQSVAVPAGAVLKIGQVQGPGARAYLCVKGGIRVPAYMGSCATFTLGRFGGHGGRPLRTADVLHLAADQRDGTPRAVSRALIPGYTHEWQPRVIYGPHGAPDFFTAADIDMLFATAWEVHYHSSRTGVRLLGPKPEWARADGGEAGLHPSNLHDNAYAIGTVDFTGDMPVILGPDGPSLGGFVCPATVIAADRWMLGQLRPGDTLRFIAVDQATANRLERVQDEQIRQLRAASAADFAGIATGISLQTPSRDFGDPVLHRIPDTEHPVGVTYRPAGDKYLLIEYGQQVLDINLRFRVHVLMLRMSTRALPGVIDLTPGIRSLQVHYDSRRLALSALLAECIAIEDELRAIDDLEVPARIVHLPLAWDDPSTRLAIEKYTQSVRKDAPWCPSNIEFIRRINGLDSIAEVQRIVFAASYLVLGLGDVYLGAPVATPMDPRHRLVTTKYNPARTWTPENAVGIGGSYLCIYGMEGPGGYQFVGRTLQMWNRYRRTREFTEPWLLRFFDQIRFYPVSPEELVDIRADFPRGRYPLRIEETSFRLRDYNEFLTQNAQSIAHFKQGQQAAFEAERARWHALGLGETAADEPAAAQAEAGALRPDEVAIASHVHGSVWQLHVEVGQCVRAGDTVAVLESMKMEIALVADTPGTVVRLLAKPGSMVAPGQMLLVMTPLDA